MDGVLADTSVWIDFVNDVKTKEVELLHSLIQEDYPRNYVMPKYSNLKIVNLSERKSFM